MINRINQKIDYQSSFIIGFIILFVGVSELVRGSGGEIIPIVNVLGGLFLLIQGYIRYNRKQKLLKDF